MLAHSLAGSVGMEDDELLGQDRGMRRTHSVLGMAWKSAKPSPSLLGALGNRVLWLERRRGIRRRMMSSYDASSSIGLPGTQGSSPFHLCESGDGLSSKAELRLFGIRTRIGIGRHLDDLLQFDTAYLALLFLISRRPLAHLTTLERVCSGLRGGRLESTVKYFIYLFSFALFCIILYCVVVELFEDGTQNISNTRQHVRQTRRGA